MCIICIEWQAGRMTSFEAGRALTESVIATSSEEELEHLQEVLEKLIADETK